MWVRRRAKGGSCDHQKEGCTPTAKDGITWSRKENTAPVSGSKAAERSFRHAQNPEKLASFAGSFDIAPMNQYAVVCHMESRRPQKM